MKMNIAKPEDLAMICYTSGTTGKPKGAMIEHQGLLCVAISAFKVLVSGNDFSSL